MCLSCIPGVLADSYSVSVEKQLPPLRLLLTLCTTFETIAGFSSMVMGTRCQAVGIKPTLGLTHRGTGNPIS